MKFCGVLALSGFKQFSDYLGDSFVRHTDGKFICLTIGNFDGCHLGHSQLLKATLSAAKEFGAMPTVMTFSPRPQEFFKGVVDSSRHIFSPEMKSRILAEFGIENHVVQTFDAELASNSHQDFFARFVAGKTVVKALVVGHDFRFGKDRIGTTDYLKGACDEAGIRLIRLDPVGVKADVEARPVSSSRIRAKISVAGDVQNARLLLGHPFMIEGIVVKGKQLGRTIGIPTANIGGIHQILPAHGVYAVRVALHPKGAHVTAPIRKVSDKALAGVLNIGMRPTVESAGAVSVEVHLLEGVFGQDELYDSMVSIYFVNRIRGEMKFAGLPQLKAQILLDIESAQKLIAADILN